MIALVSAAGPSESDIIALDLFGISNGLSDDDLGQLFALVPNLRYLALGGELGVVTDAALGHLGRSCKKLAHLHIAHCR